MQEGTFNFIGDNVQIDSSSRVTHCHIEHAQIGSRCVLSHCVIKGRPDRPVLIDQDVELIQCDISASRTSRIFSFGPWSSSSHPTSIGPRCRFHQSTLEDSQIGPDCEGLRCGIAHSRLGSRCQIRTHANLQLVSAATDCHLGSELSKTILEGAGFVSEHTGSYLSLVAPASYPILRADGREHLLSDLPNLTNIGAGTVFANYSGQPLPADHLDASSGSQKGTAIVYGAFTAVNSVIVNRYGQISTHPNHAPHAHSGEGLDAHNDAHNGIFSWLRRSDLTILGFGCFVERKVSGRIPAFSYAASTHAGEIQIGWVLERYPGILLNILKKMQKQLNTQAGLLCDLVEGTIRLEIRLLEEALQQKTTPFRDTQLKEGIALLSKHLDGRWQIDESGQICTPWRYDTHLKRWHPQP